ncbi:MAG: hypothetical protein CL912_12665 [Deltaproteobacteria bacterium]|nr:hypothetical protein [Deltaproteobacteria bacterium]
MIITGHKNNGNGVRDTDTGLEHERRHYGVIHFLNEGWYSKEQKNQIKKSLIYLLGFGEDGATSLDTHDREHLKCR